MIQRLLVSGDRSSFTTLGFNDETRELSKLADYQAPYNASWVEVASSTKDKQNLIGLSEGEDSGLVYTFEIDHEKHVSKITSQRPTLGAPAHFIMLRDQSGLALSTYLGGSLALYQMESAGTERSLFKDVDRAEHLFDFTYKQEGTGPVAHRQRQCHAHQVLEDQRGLLYVPDLGADRIWILRRKELRMTVCGWLQCPSGTGPRHAVFAHNETMIYVIGELSHQVLAYDIAQVPSQSMQPEDSFTANVIPPSAHPEYTAIMDSAEICSHPCIPNVLYVSNRWEGHIKYPDEDYRERATGDAVAVILLSSDGRKVESIKHVRTGLDVIRGMRLSQDGRFAVVAGQEGGGVEIYRIEGARGDEWELAARLENGLESGIKHAIWL